MEMMANALRVPALKFDVEDRGGIHKVDSRLRGGVAGTQWRM